MKEKFRSSTENETKDKTMNPKKIRMGYPSRKKTWFLICLFHFVIVFVYNEDQMESLTHTGQPIYLLVDFLGNGASE